MPSRPDALPVLLTRLDGSAVSPVSAESPESALSALSAESAQVLSRVGAEPAMVLPGGPCRGPEYLESFAGLGDEHPFVVLHARGTPRTGGLSRGWWTDADDVIAAADSLGVARLRLVAHSAGTRLALAVATRYPERVESMVLVTPPATWLSGTTYDGEELPADRHDPAVASAITALQEPDAPAEAAFREQFLRQAPASYAHWGAAERQNATIGAVSLAAARAWFDGIPEDAAAQVRRAARVPTLVVAGDRDLLTGLRPVVDYADALDAELHVIEDCGHYPWVEQPAAFREVMSDWLRRRRPAAG